MSSEETKSVNEDTGLEKLELPKIPIDSLIPYDKKLFDDYNDDRFKEMVESISKGRVFQPISVRPTKVEGQYQILSGHNRRNAAKEAGKETGKETIPAVIHYNLTEEEALVIVIESNNQRSIKELKPSKFAKAIREYYNAIKKIKGYRSDIRDLDKESDNESDNESTNESTLEPIAPKSSAGKAGVLFGCSGDVIKRYLRLAKLDEGLIKLLDNKRFGLHAAVELSYLSPKEQQILFEILEKENKIKIKISITLAKKLRVDSEQRQRAQLDELSFEEIEFILEPENSKPEIKTIKLSKDFLLEFFKGEKSVLKIETEIKEALKEYRDKHK